MCLLAHYVCISLKQLIILLNKLLNIITKNCTGFSGYDTVYVSVRVRVCVFACIFFHVRDSMQSLYFVISSSVVKRDRPITAIV